MTVSQRAHLFIHMHWGATWHILSGACIFYTCKAVHHCMTFLSHIAYSTYVIWSYAHTFLSVVHIVCRLAVTVLSERLCLSLCGFAPLFSACASTHPQALSCLMTYHSHLYILVCSNKQCTVKHGKFSFAAYTASFFETPITFWIAADMSSGHTYTHVYQSWWSLVT